MEGLPNVNNLQEVVMSRTYRRRKDKAPEWVTHYYIWEYSQGYAFKRIPYKGKALKKEVAKWHSDAGWHGNYSACPGWWIHEFMEKPFRTKSRKALKEILHLEDYDEADVPIVYKKPYIYYW